MLTELEKTPTVFNPIQEKWGGSVTSGETGFVAIPDVLIKNQLTLGLDVTDIAILLNILMYWWKSDELPHPRPSVISSKIGLSTRTVERRIKKMDELGLVKRLPSEQKFLNGRNTSITVRKYNLEGLINKLEGLALSIQIKH